MDFDVNYIKQCVAPGVEPAAIEAIINETSGYNELAVKSSPRMAAKRSSFASRRRLRR